MGRSDLWPKPNVRLAHTVLEVTQFEGRTSPTVAPHAGAWIETIQVSIVCSIPQVAPHAGAWIAGERICLLRQESELRLIANLGLEVRHLPHWPQLSDWMAHNDPRPQRLGNMVAAIASKYRAGEDFLGTRNPELV